MNLFLASLSNYLRKSLVFSLPSYSRPVPSFFACVCVNNVTCPIVAPQPLSPAEMQAVMMASEKEMFHRHQHDMHTEMSPHQQHQAMLSGRGG